MGFNCGIVGLPNVGKSTLFNALTATQAAQAANYPFCTIEPNVGRVAVPDPRLDKLAGIAGIGQDRGDAARVRRHRRPGEGRVEGRRARQPVPRHHPRGRCDRPRAALLRGRRRDACVGQRRSGARCRGRRDRADAGRPRQPREAPAQPREAGQGRRQGSRGRGAGGDEGARRVARGQPGARGRDHRRRAARFLAPAAHHGEADDVRAERRGVRGGDGQCA